MLSNKTLTMLPANPYNRTNISDVYVMSKEIKMKSERQLIEESKELLSLAEKVQNETLPIQERETLLNNLAEIYHEWYRAALILFDNRNQPGERQKFEQEYLGSIWSGKIIKFLTLGLQISPLYDPSKPIFDKWSFPFPINFKEPFLKQCNILASLEHKPSAVENGEDNSWNTTIRRIFTVFIEKAEKAQTNHAKKLTYEYLAIFLIGAVEGLTVIGHDERGASEEIDLWVANDSKDSFWQRIGNIFIIECKNWGSPVGAPEVRNLTSVMHDKNINFSILMSKNGITGDGYHDANDIIRKAVRDHKYIIVLDQADLLEIANGIHPTKKIREKYYDLLMRS
jgi:hypothetical protein